MNKIRNYKLYVLNLEGGYFYIGMTSYRDINRRFSEHIEGSKGSAWTRLHKPEAIAEVRDLGIVSEPESAAAETALTLEYIGRYGLDRVRGGSLCSLDPSRLQKIYSRLLRRSML